ncbi:hypothetical protein ACTFIZ_007615 [Dictyostelium cf. discoideum]
MRTLLKKGIVFKWSEDLELERKHLLDKLCKPIILWYYNQNEVKIIEVDASNDGIGAILRQGKNILGIFNRSLNNTEKSYSATEREGLAFVESINHFSPFLKIRDGK